MINLSEIRERPVNLSTLLPAFADAELGLRRYLAEEVGKGQKPRWTCKMLKELMSWRLTRGEQHLRCIGSA